jgi:hypothetical protein
MAKFLWPFLFFATSIFGDVVEDSIKQISLHDRVCMNAFFDHAIKHDQAAHVLFFKSKPACLVATILKHKNKRFNEIICLKGWRAFKKHEHLFPQANLNFIFSENVVDFSEDFKVLHVYIINKYSLAKCLEQHLELFKKELGESFSTENFISELEKGSSLPALLNHDEMLLGVLLGFGEESSKAFKEAANALTLFTTSPTEDDQCFDLKQPKGCKIAPVVFMGNPHSKEVQQLCAIYEKELEAIWKAYRASKDHLKMVLQRLYTAE